MAFPVGADRWFCPLAVILGYISNIYDPIDVLGITHLYILIAGLGSFIYAAVDFKDGDFRRRLVLVEAITMVLTTVLALISYIMAPSGRQFAVVGGVGLFVFVAELISLLIYDETNYIKERKYQDTYNELSFKDVLTQIGNRAAFDKRLDDLAGSFDEKYAKVGQELDNEYIALLKKSISSDTPELKELPLAMVSTDAVLDLTKHINPFWATEISTFAEKVVKPITGSADKLTEADWGKIKAHFAAFEAWQNGKAGAAVEKLGEARLDAILASKKSEEISALIARDKALEPEFNRLTNVDKMIRYYKFLFKLLNNFVSFKDFYNKEKRAIFQAGTLYLDSRSCTLCIKVDDVAAHSARAVAANTFLLYCECTRKHTGEKMNVAVAVTDGESDQLIVGRNGIFVDTKGNYWDAVITKVVDHPISIRQAFWSPYKKLGALINEQIEKYASSKDKAVTENFTAKVGEASTKLQTPAPAPAAGAAPAAAPAQASSFNAAQFAGIFAAIGLALATIGSAISSVVSGFMALSWWQMPLAIIGILLLISGPSMILTAMKLHKRNLGSILDANGWAINTRARINITMGRYLTSVAKLPDNAKRNFDDPFKEEKNHWRMWLSIILVILLLMFFFLPGFAESRHMVKAFFIGESTCEEPAKKAETAEEAVAEDK